MACRSLISKVDYGGLHLAQCLSQLPSVGSSSNVPHAKDGKCEFVENVYSLSWLCRKLWPAEFTRTMIPRPVHTLTATPTLPPALERLRELAYNLRWAWDEEILDLFRRIGADRWSASGHNPVLLLGTISRQALIEASEDESFMAHFKRACASHDDYMAQDSTWYRKSGGDAGDVIAYFSAEFGVTECLPIFAGGLGALAGDHLKSASDMGIPLVGMGLLYQQGYFSQHLNEAGWQQETYHLNDFANLPLVLERDDNGEQQTVSVDFPGRQVHARIWRLQVGRIPLYLLDTNISENPREEDRDLTDYLYGGGDELRIRQEVMLGIGGYRALEALDLQPKVYHINEGHSAFLALERIRTFMQERGLSFNEARLAAAAGIVFTTHTPVEAGHDRFASHLMDTYLTPFAERELQISRRDFLGLGRQDAANDNEKFGMTKLALRTCAVCNGVAKLHGEVSRKMWQDLWPGIPEHEVPIGHVTNGVHVASWLSSDMKQLLDRYLGPRWRSEPGDKRIWSRVDQIPGAALWRTHVLRRERLIDLARKRVRLQRERVGAPQSEQRAAAAILDPQALTIGFARRFATYKRATLLLRDRNRLARIVSNEDYPVQIIFAGKAHPRDQPGKELIQRIVAIAGQDPLCGRIVFLEDYDMAIARAMVQGADVWLNTPRRPREASGTSGMKAAVNGCLNASVLDGWWDEAYRPDLGWAIGTRESMTDEDRQDALEASNLYDLLEHDIVPMFYRRESDGLPREWIQRMQGSIAEYSARFNSHRMVEEYYTGAYERVTRKAKDLLAKGTDNVKALTKWSDRIVSRWPAVQVRTCDMPAKDLLQVGETFCVRARVDLGGLQPDDVDVQLYFGEVNAAEEIVHPLVIPLELVEENDGGYTFGADAVMCPRSGHFGYTARVIPKDKGVPWLRGWAVWASTG